MFTGHQNILTKYKAVYLPGVNIRCEESSKRLILLFFFVGTATGQANVDMLHTSTISAIHELYGNDQFFFR